MEEKYFPFPNREACAIIYEEDPCYGKIPEEKRRAAFDEAWELGIRTADEAWASAKQPADLREILRENGLVFLEKDVDYVVGNTRYFCDYQSEKDVVTIYGRSVALWAENNSMPYESAVQLILAHELFHFYEWRRIGLTSKRCLVPMLKLGRLELGKTGIAALSEIGANAFANEWYTLSAADGQMPEGKCRPADPAEPAAQNAPPERSLKNILDRMLSI